MRESILIANRWINKPSTLINSIQEIYDACRHKTKFHSFTQMASETDERSERDPEMFDDFPIKCLEHHNYVTLMGVVRKFVNI